MSARSTKKCAHYSEFCANFRRAAPEMMIRRGPKWIVLFEVDVNLGDLTNKTYIKLCVEYTFLQQTFSDIRYNQFNFHVKHNYVRLKANALPDAHIADIN